LGAGGQGPLFHEPAGDKAFSVFDDTVSGFYWRGVFGFEWEYEETRWTGFFSSGRGLGD
jgi:hypothetical protein